MRAWRDGLLGRLHERPELDLFLDFDGTLAAIAAHPDDVQLAVATRTLLVELAARPHTRVIIVSGRHLAGLIKRLDYPAIPLVGNHGLEWRCDGVIGEDEAVARVRPAMSRIAAAIREEVAATPGAVLEEKGGSLSLHLRAAEVDAAARLRAQLLGLAATEPLVRTHGGHGLVEVRPAEGPNKGTAILRLLHAQHGAAWPERTTAIFIGDDVTDEDGFLALGDAGLSVLVAPKEERPTAAQFSAASVDDVLELLAAIAAR